MNEEEVEERLDAYSELKTTLEEVKPGDRKISAIVSMMGYTNLDNLEALRDNLKLAGWRINDIQLAIKSWGYRRGLIKSEDDIEKLIEVEKVEKAEKEEVEEEKEEKGEKELEDLVKQKFRDTGRVERIKLYRDILASREKEPEKKGEEERKIAYVVSGVPVQLTQEEYLAMKRWEEEKERREKIEKEEKEEKEEKVREGEEQKTITWKFRDGEIKEVAPDALGYVIISDVLLEELKGLREKKGEEEKEEKKAPIRVSFADGRTLEVREDFYPFVMQIEREKEYSAELRKELTSVKDQFNSFNPWAYVKEQTEVMKEMGWTQTPTGRTAWDVAAQATSDLHSAVTFLGGKFVDKYGIAPEFTAEERYTEEERGKKKEELERKTASSKDLMKVENEILKL